MKRSELRENIFKLLFMAQFKSVRRKCRNSCVCNFEAAQQGREDVVCGRDPSREEEDYMEAKYSRICEKLPEIDAFLNRISVGWKTSRMNKVDLTILRLAVYEMQYDEEVPTAVAINEAVELAKRFGGEDSTSFVNGILGKAAREQDKEQVSSIYTVGQVNAYIKKMFVQDFYAEPHCR